MQPWAALFIAANLAGGGESPALTHPADGAIVYLSIPSFRWRGTFETDPRAMPSYVIQIASDRGFTRIIDEDRPAADIGDAENVVFRNNRILRPRGEDVPINDLLQFRNVHRLVKEGNKMLSPTGR